jgi:hypothetical protein
LEWEVTTLRPILSTYFSTKKNQEDLKTALKTKILPILDQSQDWLLHYPQNNDIVSVADIVIWCDLYPILHDSPEIIGSIPRVKVWMEYLIQRKPFKDGLEAVILSKGNKKKWNWSSWTRKVNYDGSGSGLKKSQAEASSPR